ncbi:MAG: hypothetical protein WA941_10940 [Nitrososphaeraceae archaeon]
MVTLAEVKHLMEIHLKQEIDVMNKWLQLNENDNNTFIDWYIRHPLRKSLKRYYGNVDNRLLGHSKTQNDGFEQLGSTGPT